MSASENGRKGFVPPIRDARWMQLAVLMTYAVVAREIFHFERTHLTMLLCVTLAVLLDLLLGRLVYKATIFPLSAVIVGLASSLLLDARTSYPYLVCALLGIVSKAFITYRGRHLFNPANFGVVVLLLLAPAQVTGMPQLFSGYFIPSVIFFVLGMVTVLWARQAEVSLAWLGGFVVFGLLRAAISGANPVMTLAPLLGPGVLLFTFHMISAPATTPKTRWPRIGFGVAVAAIDAGFRYLEIPYGNFYALFAVSAVIPWIWEREGVLGPRRESQAALA